MIDFEIHQGEIDQVKSPYVLEMVVQTILDKMDAAINSGGRVIFRDHEGNIELVLFTNAELNVWKERNKFWLPDSEPQE